MHARDTHHTAAIHTPFSKAAVTRWLTVALLVAASASLHAQTHRVDAPDRVTRAIGVYEWIGELDKPVSARLVPISIFINSHLEDAGVYLARPVPFALDTGDVYSIEHAGRSVGELDLESARDIITRRSVSDDDPAGAWYGYGTFHSAAELAKLEKARQKRLEASAKLPSIDGVDSSTDSAEPHFVYRKPSTASTGKPATDSSQPATSTPVPNPAPDDDPERPTLRRRPTTDTNEKDNQRKKDKPQGFVTPPNTPLNDDPDRPVLHRGIPAQLVVAPELNGLPPDMHQMVAVSDPANREPHIFTRMWATPHERDQVLDLIEQLARPRVQQYEQQNQLTPVAAATLAAIASEQTAPVPTGPVLHAGPTLHSATTDDTTSQSAAKSPRSGHATKSAQAKSRTTQPALALQNESVEGYQLTYGGLPTFIYTAESPITTGGPVYITMVVQRLPSNELQVALSSVTDAAHLDRTPWMRPIDVVDVDWSHRGSLLFELRAQTSRQFALYQLITAKAEQTFTTGILE
jgi:hypothetical protein